MDIPQLKIPSPPGTPPAPGGKHPLELLPPSDGKSRVFENTNILRHLAQGRSPFIGGQVQQQFNNVHPWMKTIGQLGGAFMGIPTMDFSSLIRRPVFTGGLIGRSPSPEFAQAAARSNVLTTPKGYPGAEGVLQSLFQNNNFGGQTIIPQEFIGMLPDAMRMMGYNPRYSR